MQSVIGCWLLVVGYLLFIFFNNNKQQISNFQCAMSYLWSFPEHSKKYFSGYHF